MIFDKSSIKRAQSLFSSDALKKIEVAPNIHLAIRGGTEVMWRMSFLIDENNQANNLLPDHVEHLIIFVSQRPKTVPVPYNPPWFFHKSMFKTLTTKFNVKFVDMLSSSIIDTLHQTDINATLLATPQAFAIPIPRKNYESIKPILEDFAKRNLSFGFIYTLNIAKIPLPISLLIVRPPNFDSKLAELISDRNIKKTIFINFKDFSSYAVLPLPIRKVFEEARMTFMR